MLAKLVFVGLLGVCTATTQLQEIFSWNVLDWAYPDEQTKLTAMNNGELIPENALPVGIERWRNKLFVSVPRWRPGIPSTLNYIPLDAPYEASPKLIPYPSWQGNELGNCASGLTTVYRIKADKCNRLWVLDVGTYGYDPNVTNVCPYSLNVYDLNTDKRIRRYVFRPEDIVPSTFIANIALDQGRSCDDTFAYFSDELGYGLIVYSWEQNKSWRFGHNYFMPDPLKGDFNIGGLNFQWGAEGIFGITTSPIGRDGYRTLYFSPLASHTEFSVSTRILRNESKVEGSYHDFKVVGDRGSNGHTTAHVMSESGVKLFTMIDQSALGCWNSALPHKPQNIGIVDKDDVALLFPCDVKIVDEKEVWVISDRMSTFLESEFGLDYSDINFRIFTAPLNSLLANTVCDPKAKFSSNAAVATLDGLVFYDSRFGAIAGPISQTPPIQQQQAKFYINQVQASKAALNPQIAPLTLTKTVQNFNPVLRQNPVNFVQQNPTLGVGQNFGQNPTLGVGQNFGQNPTLGVGQNFGQSPTPGIGQNFGLNPTLGVGQNYGQNPVTYGGSKVSSYFNFLPQQSTIPQIGGKSSLTKNSWWEPDRNYKVYE